MGSPLLRLPLVTLYLTERCNSRCVTCDYWRHGRIDLDVARWSGCCLSLRRLETRVVLISGGEPLLNPEWPAMAALLKAEGLKLWLLTSGLSWQSTLDAYRSRSKPLPFTRWHYACDVPGDPWAGRFR